MTNELEPALTPGKAVVGCVGLGIMGAPAARNIIRGGYETRFYARRAASLTDFADHPRHASPAELGAHCDVAVTNVSDSADVESVVIGANGLSGGLREGAIVIDMSTIAPKTARRIAGKLSDKGIFFLDAPVSGGQQGAIDGALTIMVGGERAAFERAMPLLKTMGKTITHVGASGAGQVVKACNQIIIGATIEGVAEALVLARQNGVDPDKARTALLGGFANSKVLDIHGKRMIQGDFAPGFKTALHRKDMLIAIENGKQNGCPLPVAKLFAERLQKLVAANGADLDSSAAFKIIAGEIET